VNCADVPEPSERTTGVIGRFGNWRPSSRLTAASFQFVIFPVKIFAIVAPDYLMLVMRWPLTSRWYMYDVPPATIGM
jgi:hypothetical protein